MEGAALIPEAVSVDGDSVSMGVRALSAYLAKAEYYLTTSNVRPASGSGSLRGYRGSRKRSRVWRRPAQCAARSPLMAGNNSWSTWSLGTKVAVGIGGVLAAALVLILNFA
jgi:hypothetical protein